MRQSLRNLALLLAPLAVTACGCAANRCARSRPPATMTVATTPSILDDATVASALVFDPPVIANEPAPALGRDDRDVSAFLGYEQSVTTYFYLVTQDNMQFKDGIWGQYQRNAVSASAGVRSR